MTIDTSRGKTKLTTRRTAAIELKEIAVLVLSTRNALYDQFKQAISSGWLREMQNLNIKCYFYSGDHEANGIQGEEICVTASDRLQHTSAKLVQALELLMDRHPETKLVYRTNLSSYVEVGNFLRFINEKQLDDTSYAGLIGETTYVREHFYRNRYLHKLFTLAPIGERIRFASGSGFFIGSENIKKIIALSSKNHHLIDDVMVARTLGISPNASLSPLRFDIKERGGHKISSGAYDKLLGDGMLFHYRFKTSDRSEDARLLAAFNDPEFRYSYCTLNGRV